MTVRYEVSAATALLSGEGTRVRVVAAQLKYRAAVVLAGTLLMALVLPLAAAQALVSGQPLSSGFPRLGVQWPDPTAQSLDAIAQYDYILLQPVFRGYVSELKARNPDAVIMTSTNPCEIGLDTSTSPSPGANAMISRVPNAWIQTQLGSNLSAAVDADDTVFELPMPSRFRVNDVLVVEDELAKVLSVGSTSITVQRGLLPARSPAAVHAAGTRVAPVVVFWPGSVVMDLSDKCPKARGVGSFQDETWGEYNARVGAQLLGTADWDGVFIDRADATPSMVVGGPFARSIDYKRDNATTPSDYAALDASWKANLFTYESSIRGAAGSKIILTNNAYPNFSLLNGMIFEATPRFSWNAPTWTDRVFGTRSFVDRSYSDWTARAQQPNFTTIQTFESELTPVNGGSRFVWPADAKPNYRKMRFGLGTALLKNGFFNYGASTAGHAAGGLFWFDEFDNNGAGRGYLGAPTGVATEAPPLTTRDLVSGDGSFSSRSQLDKWRIYAPYGYKISKATSGGTAGLAITAARGGTDNATFYHDVSVKAGQVYTLSFRARASKSLWIRERVSDKAYPSTTVSDFIPLNLGTSWKRYEMSFVSKKTYDHAVLAFGIGEKPATIWFDDVKLQSGARLNAYSRQFQHGKVLVNANVYPATMPLGGVYRKINGDEDPAINNGAYVSSVVLGAQDGLVLLKTPTLTVPSDSILAYGSGTSVSGSLKSTAGAMLPGRKIVLRSSLDGRTWRDVAVTTTTVSGTYSFPVRPTRSTFYMSRFYGDGVNLEGFSRVLRVKVKVRVSNPSAASTMSRTKSYTVKGTISPRHSSGSHPVRIYKYRLVSGRWKSYGYTTATASNYSSTTTSKLSASVRLKYTGKWRLRAYHPEDTSHAATWSSGYDYVKVY